MNAKDDLERLRQHAQSLEASIDSITHEVESALQARDGSGQMIDYLRERHRTQLGLMYELGKVEARIEPLEERVREAQEQPQERLATSRWDAQQPLAPEDHLDWFKQSLAENPPQVDTIEIAEQRMVDDMERDPAPEDHLDWLSEQR